MPKGGKRPNAGRPKKYASNFHLGLINEVGLIKAKNPRWKNQQILDELQRQGKLTNKARATVTRMLESRFNVFQTEDGEIDLREALTTLERNGLLAALPTLEKNN